MSLLVAKVTNIDISSSTEFVSVYSFFLQAVCVCACMCARARTCDKSLSYGPCLGICGCVSVEPLSVNVCQ